MNIQVNKVHYPVRSLGPGRRIAIWFQGCSIRCKGCVSVDTWPSDDRKKTTVEELVSWCKALPSGGVDGVTISGGEPFDQPEGLHSLLQCLRGWQPTWGEDCDILCYTGFGFSFICENYPDILNCIDAIVTEPFDECLPTEKYLCGSHNQILRGLSDLGRQRYEQERDEVSAEKRMDVCVSDDAVWLAGIPRYGDLRQLRTLVEARGIKLGKISWRA